MTRRLAVLFVCIAGLTFGVGVEGELPRHVAADEAKTEAPVVAAKPAATSTNADESALVPDKQLFSGQVVLLTDALKKRKIKSYDEEFKDQVVLDADSGDLIPILPDWRGRAFYQDERLRNRKVELVGYRRPGVPYLHVLMVFTFDEKGERQYTDYWCDVCAIPMYEIKKCDCCQAEIRLRFTKQDLPDYLTQKSASTAK